MAKNENVIDLSQLLKGYKGKWVVVSGDRSKVLCFADDIDEVLKEAEKYKGHPILLRVPDENTAHLL